MAKEGKIIHLYCHDKSIGKLKDNLLTMIHLVVFFSAAKPFFPNYRKTFYALNLQYVKEIWLSNLIERHKYITICKLFS